jgi:hypothetical protein
MINQYSFSFCTVLEHHFYIYIVSVFQIFQVLVLESVKLKLIIAVLAMVLDIKIPLLLINNDSCCSSYRRAAQMAHKTVELPNICAPLMPELETCPCFLATMLACCWSVEMSGSTR